LLVCGNRLAMIFNKTGKIPLIDNQQSAIINLKDRHEA